MTTLPEQTIYGFVDGRTGADSDEVEVYFPDVGIKVQNWTSYELNQHFLTPTDGWRFTIGDEFLTDELVNALVPGQKVEFYINGLPQCVGYIGKLTTHADRRSGTVLTVEGRDVFAPLVDSGLDPKLIFPEGTPYEEVVRGVLKDFGFNDVLFTNEANRALQTAKDTVLHSTKTAANAPKAKAAKDPHTTTRGAKAAAKSEAKRLQKATAHQVKPYPNEGAYEFLARISSRYGLFLWPSADGKQVIISKPAYLQTPVYKLLCKREGDVTNILSATAVRDWDEQPSAIVATGRGGDLARRQGMTAYAVNPWTGNDKDGTVPLDLAKRLQEYPTAKQVNVLVSPGAQRYVSRTPRIMYVHDDNSQNLEQLQYFVRRELSMKMRRVLTYSVAVQGHTQAGVPWCVDTMVEVDDDLNNLHENMYLLSRTFSKSRSEGTKTHLELIREGTLDLGEEPT
jgi:prophage tail gpP-like protein